MKSSLLSVLMFSVGVAICQTPAIKVDTFQVNKYASNIQDFTDKKDFVSATLYSDSLLNLVEEVNDAIILDKSGKAAYKLAVQLITVGEFYEAEKLNNRLLQLYERANNQEKIGTVYNLFSRLYGTKQEYQKAEKYANKAKIIFASLNDPIRLGQSLQNIANIKLLNGELEQAITPYLEAMELFKKKNNLKGMATCTMSLGMIMKKLKNFPKSEEYYTNALKLYEADKDKDGVARCYQNMGNLKNEYFALDSNVIHLNNMMTYYKKAENVYQELGDKKQIAAIKSNIGVTYRELKNYPKAITELNEAMALKKELGIKDHDTYTALGKCYIGLHDYKKAIEYLEKSVQIAKENNNISNLEDVLKSLAKAYEMSGEYNIANKKLHEASIIADTLLTKTNHKFVEELETKYQTAEKEKKIAESDKQIAEQNLQILTQKTTVQNQWYGIAFSGLIAALLGFGFYYNQKRRKDEQYHNQLLRQKNEEIETLNTEITHRVGNNLQLMAGLMELQGRRMTSEEGKKALKENENRIQAMAILHNRLKAQNGISKIDMKEYLKELSEGLRVAHSHVTKEIDIHLDTDNVVTNADFAMRLGLIINELVTNSIKHGFANQDNPRIDIQLREDDKQIYMVYRDNGKGISEPKDMSRTQSLGVKLIYSITKQLFGNVKTENQNGVFYQFDFKKTL